MRFMLETMVELILCIAVGFGFREQVKSSSESLTTTDRVTDVATYILFIFLIIFLIAVTRFTVCDARKLHITAMESKKLRYKTFVE